MNLPPWYRVCTKAIFLSKGRYGYGETRKCIPLVGAKTRLTCAGRETTSSQGNRYRPENGNLPKLGSTYRHGTVFAPRQYLYQKEDKGVEKPEMYSSSRCKNHCYLCWTSNYPSQGSRYRPAYGNLRKLECTYHQGTVFAPRQYLHQKEATGMERPEMYFQTRCKNPSHLCGPSNYPVSKDSV